MIKITLKEQLEGLGNILNKINNPRRVMERVGAYMVSSTHEKINKATPPNSPLTILNKRGRRVLKDTGHLFKSITYRAKKKSVVVGTDRKYAYVHQFGATITPKNADKLAIPFGWKMRREVERYGSVRAVIEEYKRRGWEIFFTEKAIVGKPRRGKARVLFVRAGKVKIPARPFLYVSRKDKARIAQIFLDSLEEIK